MELEWDLGEEIIRFVAHVVPRNSGLLLSRSALKALRATIDLRNDQLHLENPGALLKLSTTPAGHYETDLVTEPVEWRWWTRFPGYLAKDGNTSQDF